MEKLKVINLFGGPCTGKSSVSAGLFHTMKSARYSVEAISEYAKQMVWERQHHIQFTDQFTIAAMQHKKQHDLIGHGIEYVITDSPLLLTNIYQPDNYYKSFSNLIFEINDSYDNLNILLERSFDYDGIGRNQNEEQAVEIHNKIVNYLNQNNIPHYTLKSNFHTHLKILDYIKTHKWNYL